MKSRLARLLSVPFLLLAAPPALAGQSPWQDFEGARLRLVTEDMRRADGRLRGALQIDLKPGWKTYWREPGSAGIPPQIGVSGGFASSVDIHYPVPEWVTDDYGSWAGYKQPVSLPLTFSVAGDGSASAIDTDVFLGICKNVCVPVSASLTISLASASGGSLQTIQVDAAFAGLPGGNTETLTIGEPSWTSDGMLEVRLSHQGDSGDETELFVAAGTAHAFRKPVPVSSDAGSTVFHVQPVFDPAESGSVELILTARHGIDTAEVQVKINAP